VTGRNWGRWGSDDERGVVNLIDDKAVLAACQTPRLGRKYDLGIPLNGFRLPGSARTPAVHLMARDGGDDGADGGGYADDYLFMPMHGSTHIDALAHVWSDGQLYNGFPSSTVRSNGAAKCGIDKVGGIVVRAHLLDFVAEPPAGETIRSADIQRYVDAHDLPVLPGDSLLFHTGWLSHAMINRQAYEQGLTVDPESAGWIADHDVVLVGADNLAIEGVTRGSGLPLHEALLCGSGVYMLELLNLSQPAADGVLTGLLVVAPLLIANGSGSPVNPILIV
jgi:kynurenine formamidase